MKRREALKVGLGLVGAAGLSKWDALLGPAVAQTPACSLVPEQAAGPFYFDSKQIRRDITEGRPGLVLNIGLKVVDADTCAPVAGALVDVWHADADGIYSGYAGQGDSREVDAREEDFMRGIQIADEEGMVEFRTVYPGWYPGRTPHVRAAAVSGARPTMRWSSTRHLRVIRLPARRTRSTAAPQRRIATRVATGT